jgi:hypothetical protein
MHALRYVHPESMFVARRSKPNILRLRLHFVVKRELNSGVVPGKRTSFYWRRCRQRLLQFYVASHPFTVKVAPVFASSRLPGTKETARLIREWNVALANSGQSILGEPRQ